MFSQGNKPPDSPEAQEWVAHQPPGEIFPWPKGTVLTALDELVIALPVEIFGKDEPIGSVVLGPDDMEINIPPQGKIFYVRLQPGMSVSLTKSCEASLVAEDKQPRRLTVRRKGTPS